MSNTADVVIIGGGVVGCAAAYYLAKAGNTNVIVLEGTKSIGHGGSSRNGGGVRQSGRDVRELPYAMYGIKHLWPTLSEELGGDVEYTQKGTANSSVCSVSAEGGFCDFSGQKTPARNLPDIGFRVLKGDTSNMKEVYYNPAAYEASLFSRLEDNIKEDRTPEDLLFQVMLDLGVLLSSKIEETTIAGKKVFNVADNYLIACFDSNVAEETIKAIAKQKPYYFVMRDSSLASDSVATNFDQIFATYSPDTIRKVL